MALRWKKHPAETGLAAVACRPRGSKLHDGEKTYAQVYSHESPFSKRTGWYWVAGWDSDVPYHNSSGRQGVTEEQAKTEAAAYVKKHLTI